jgi:putative transposase
VAKPLDHDLRIRLVAAVDAGMTCRAAARQFAVSDSAVIKLVARYRATGSVTPGKMGGHRRPVLNDQRDWILSRISEQPDLTTRALADELAERGVKVSHVSVWNLLRRERRSHKKVADCQRAGPSRCRPPTQAVARASGIHRSKALGFH